MDTKEKERAEGWGWISASAATAIAWGMVYGLGQDVHPSILIGSFGMGVWKVARGSRFRGWKIVRK